MIDGVATSPGSCGTLTFRLLDYFDLFFERVGHRIKQVVNRGEAAGILNVADLGETIESDSHQCFRFKSDRSLAGQIENFFAPKRIQDESERLVLSDPLVKKAQEAYQGTAKPGLDPDIFLALNRMKTSRSSPADIRSGKNYSKIRSSQRAFYLRKLVLRRLTNPRHS